MSVGMGIACLKRFPLLAKMFWTSYEFVVNLKVESPVVAWLELCLFTCNTKSSLSLNRLNCI